MILTIVATVLVTLLIAVPVTSLLTAMIVGKPKPPLSRKRQFLLDETMAFVFALLHPLDMKHMENLSVGARERAQNLYDRYYKEENK